MILIVPEDDETPASQRQRLNAFLYLAASIYEAFLFARSQLGQEFREADAFRELFVPLFKDADVRELVERVLQPLRNKGVFHYTDDDILDGLATLEQEDYELATGYTQASGQVYYSMADEAVFRSALGLEGTSEQVHTQLRDFIHRTTKLSNRFCVAAEKLISQELPKHWHVREHDGR